MAKTDKTVELERNIYGAICKLGVFGCFEVTIGWYGKERVDFLTYDTKGIWRCFEIKVSVPDFRSKAHNTFIGHYNYYVMTKELYEKVKDEIPSHIGVYLAEDGCTYCIKKPKRQELLEDVDVLKDSFIRSLSREVNKGYKSGNPRIIDNLNRTISRLEKDNYHYKRGLQKIRNERFIESRSRVNGLPGKTRKN